MNVHVGKIGSCEDEILHVFAKLNKENREGLMRQVRALVKQKRGGQFAELQKKRSRQDWHGDSP
jgi:hypothetical protein